MCVSLRGHSTGLGVAGFAIRSRRDDGIDHVRCLVARSPKTMTKTRADPSARLKPPDSPAADAPRAKAQAVPLEACGMRAQRGPFTVVVNAARARARRGGPTGTAGGRGRGPRPDRSTGARLAVRRCGRVDTVQLNIGSSRRCLSTKRFI